MGWSRSRADSLGRPAESVTFSLHKDYHLTSIKVVVRGEAETNKYPHTLWELASKTGSAPVNGLSYGTPVEGMNSASTLGAVEPLKQGVQYRLIVEAGSVRGTNDFSLTAATAER